MPGVGATKALKVLLAIFALLNIKVWPLMFHARFYYIVGTAFFLRRKVKAKSVFEPTSYLTYTPLLEMDFNLHKSNSTYFSDMDMSRATLMAHVFKDFYRSYRDSSVNMKSHQWTYTPLGSVGLVFRAELPGYVPYNVKSQVVGWTQKWLFVVSRFERNGKVHAFGLSKYVFKQQRKTVAPAEAIAHCGLLTPQAVKQNEAVAKWLETSLTLEELNEKFNFDS